MKDWEILENMDEYKQITGLWKKALKNQWEKPYFISLRNCVQQKRLQETVYPKKGEVFTAFREVPLEKVQVVILGQDPYHGENQACGVAFAVQKGTKIPPSLRNIYKEIKEDMKKEPKDLLDLQKQGVFLLNTLLTVSENAPLSHKKIGWEQFIDATLKVLWEKKEKIVFLLWGNNAKKRVEGIFTKDNGHLVLCAGHPSPLSVRKFSGCRHFSQANAFLKNTGREIIWTK